jgi:predicted PurR-regulated permease PerM
MRMTERFGGTESQARAIRTVVAAIAILTVVALAFGGLYIVVQLRELSVNLSRLTTQLNTLERMDSKLDTLQAMMKALDAMNAKLSKTNQALGRMGGNIGKMTEKITGAKLLF